MAKEKKTYKIAVFAGDGIGPEVVREGLKVLHEVESLEGFGTQLIEYPYCTQHYLDTGELMPESIFDELRKFDAILVGAIGDPRVEVGLVERDIIGGIRFKLDLYVNLRPIKLYAEHLCPLKDKKPEDIDFVVVRENTEDLYAGIGGFLKKGTPDEVALQEMIFTRKGVERVIRYAFEVARKRKVGSKLPLGNGRTVPKRCSWGFSVMIGPMSPTASSPRSWRAIFQSSTTSWPMHCCRSYAAAMNQRNCAARQQSRLGQALRTRL